MRVTRVLCISFKIDIDKVLRQQIMRFRLSITTLQDVLGLKNAGDLFRLHFSFAHYFHPTFRIIPIAVQVAATVLGSGSQRVPSLQTAYP